MSGHPPAEAFGVIARRLCARLALIAAERAPQPPAEGGSSERAWRRAEWLWPGFTKG